MSRNNTGNPIGSKAFPDFEDNVKNLDEAVNTADPQWVDRFGRFRLPLMEQERQFVSDQERREGEFQADQSSREAVFSDFLQASGYQDLGEYAPGIEITAHNQYVTFGGQPYTLKPSIPVPYTTSGGWTGADFKLIGDDSLRQDLSNPDKGAAMVARGVVAVDSIADLLALPEGQRKEGLRYLVKGYHAGSDAGGGELYWDSSSTSPVNNVTVFGSESEAGRFIRPKSTHRDISEAGALPSIADNLDAIIRCRDWCRESGEIMTGVGDFTVSDTVDLRMTPMDVKGRILTQSVFPAVIMGGDSTVRNCPNQFLFQGACISAGVDNPHIEVRGMRGGTLTIQRCLHVKLIADTSPELNDADTSIAYNEFNFLDVHTLHLTTNYASTGSTVQWINENTFNLKRTTRLWIDGTFGPNHNFFDRPCLEGAAEIKILNGRANIISDARFEGDNVNIEFGSGASGNQISYSYLASPLNYTDMEYRFPIIVDNGVGNTVDPTWMSKMTRVDLFSLSGLRDTVLVSSGGSRLCSVPGANPLRVGLYGCRVNNFQQLYRSQLIPMRSGDVLHVESDKAFMRCDVKFYDAGLNLITSEPELLAFPGNPSWEADNNRIRQQNAMSSKFALILRDPGVSFIELRIAGGNTAGSVPFSYCMAQMLTKGFPSPMLSKQRMEGAPVALVSTTVPSIGVAAANTIVRNPGGGGWYASSRASTTVASALSGTQIDVADAAGIVVGAVIGIATGAESAHWAVVQDVSGATVEFSPAFAGTISVGARVESINWQALAA